MREYFIPTEWYPTALAVQGEELLIASGKGEGTGPNAGWEDNPSHPGKRQHPYIASLIRGSIARVNLADTEREPQKLTAEVVRSNQMEGRIGDIVFPDGAQSYSSRDLRHQGEPHLRPALRRHP